MGTAQSQTPNSAGNADSETANINAVINKTPKTEMDDSKASTTTTTQTKIGDSKTNENEAANTDVSNASATEFKMDNGKTGNDEAADDGSRKSQPSGLEAAMPHVDTLTRMQRALAMKHLPKLEDGVKCEYPSPFDERRASRYPFECNVIFVALHVEVQKNDYDDLKYISVGIAKLDTEELDMLPPGREGGYFEEEVKLCSFEADGLENDNFILTDPQIGTMRMRVAQAFENGGPGVKAIDLLNKEREFIVVTDDLTQLKRNLAILGFNFRQHAGLIDIIDVPMLDEAMLAWYARQLPSEAYEMAFCDEPRYPPEVPKPEDGQMRRYCEARAKTTMIAMIKLALEDIKTDVEYKVDRHGNGGAFPGPYRQLETEEQKLAYQLERILRLGFPDSAKEIRQCTQALLGTKTKDGAPKKRHEKYLPARPESSRAPRSVAAAHVSQAAQTQSSSSELVVKSPAKDESSTGKAAANESKITASKTDKDQSKYPVAVSPGPQAAAIASKVSESKSDEEQGKQSSVVSTSEVSQSANTAVPPHQTPIKTPQPELIAADLYAYHRREEDFSRKVKVAAAPHCPKIDDFYEAEEYDLPNGDVKVTHKISPPENYLTLAGILAKHPECISIDMVEDLLWDKVQREEVDAWFSSLPSNDVQRDEKEIKAHQEFREVLQAAYDILCGALAPTVPDLAEQMEEVAAKAKGGWR